MKKKKHSRAHAHTKKRKRIWFIWFCFHFESLLITRINAAFSSFKRVLSALIESIFYKNKFQKCSSNLSFFHLLLILLLIPKSFVHRLVFPRKENPMKFDRLIIDIDLSYLILINNILHNWIRKYIVLPVLMTSLSFSLGFRGWKIRRKSLTRLSNDDSIYCDVF